MNRKKAAVAASMLAITVLSLAAASRLPGQEARRGQERLQPLALRPRAVRVVNAETEAVPVRVTDAPPVAIEGVASVQVTNAQASPVPVWNAAHPALQPWHQSFDLGLVEGETSKQLFLDIPAGKRLVLEHVSASLVVMPQQAPVLSFFGTNPSAAGVPHVLHVENVGPWGNSIQSLWTASHPMKVYLDDALLRLSRAGGTTGPLFATVAFSGFLVDLP
jgi:hypothetical protein